MRYSAAFCAGLLAFPISIAAQGEASPRSWDYVEFEVKSWGSTVTSWRLTPDGGGSWTEAVRPEGSPLNVPPSLAWHEIEPARTNYETMVHILDRLPSPAPDFQSCSNFMSDGAYGTLRVTKGATTTEIAWNSGCLDEEYLAFLGTLKAADEHIQALGKAAPVIRTDPPPGD